VPPAAYRDVAKGAAYRQRAMPDVAPARRPAPAAQVFRHRVTFEKTGDARFLSHRNTMDVLERAIRASGLPARYSEGFNPHMKLSMGPALPLGLESRHEVFDVEATSPFGSDADARINAKLPPGLHVTEIRELSPSEPSLSKLVAGARYAVELPSPELVERAHEAIAGAWRESLPALKAMSLEGRGDSPQLRFEVNLDQAAGPTATARNVLETLLAIPPEAQAALSVTREATVLKI